MSARWRRARRAAAPRHPRAHTTRAPNNYPDISKNDQFKLQLRYGFHILNLFTTARRRPRALHDSRALPYARLRGCSGSVFMKHCCLADCSDRGAAEPPVCGLPLAAGGGRGAAAAARSRAAAAHSSAAPRDTHTHNNLPKPTHTDTLSAKSLI